MRFVGLCEFGNAFIYYNPIEMNLTILKGWRNQVHRFLKSSLKSYPTNKDAFYT